MDINLIKDQFAKIAKQCGAYVVKMKIDVSKVTIILDIKCPSSDMCDKNLWSNIDLIKKTDEIKFVIGDKKDYEWSKNIIKEYNLLNKCKILFSPVYDKIEAKDMVEWILKDNLNVRFQTQLHKTIWPHDTKGV